MSDKAKELELILFESTEAKMGDMVDIVMTKTLQVVTTWTE